MNRFDPNTEYSVTRADYATALTSLPATGTDGQLASSVAVMVREFRLNTSQTVNAGKWTLWSISPQPIVFVWHDGAWQPPQNVVVW
jgi:hypothetical protein